MFGSVISVSVWGDVWHSGSYSRLLSERLGLSVCPAASLGCAFIRVLLRLIPVRTREPRKLRSKLPVWRAAWMCTFILLTVLLSVMLWFGFWRGAGLGWKTKPGNNTTLSWGCGLLGLSRIPAAALVSGSSSALALVEAEVTIDFSWLSRPEKRPSHFTLRKSLLSFLCK